MAKTKLLTILVLALALLNIGLLLAMFFGRGGRHDGRQNRNRIIEKLHFDDTQIAKYDALIDWHRAQIAKHDERANTLKQQLYLQLLKQTPDEKSADSLMDLLAENHKEVEKVHFKHFQDIKSLCHKSQLNDYFELSEQLAQMFSRPNPPGPNP